VIDEFPHPPAHVAAYVRALGPELAVKFLMTFGGADLAIGSNPQRRSRLVRTVGYEPARRLADIGGLPKRVPLAKPWIARMLAFKGLSTAEIARRLHASDVAVRRWLSGSVRDPRRDDRQGTLF